METIEMSNCCASDRFLFWEVFPLCVCVSACVRAHARLPSRKGGVVCLTVGHERGIQSWKTAAEQSTSRSPGCRWSLATPAVKTGEIHAHCSSERVVGVLDAGITALLV